MQRISIEQYNKEIDEAVARIEAGEFYTHEEVEKLLEAKIPAPFILTDEQLKIVEEEHALHLNGQSKSYTREEADQIIRGKRDF